ncbi:hypothetical protein [Nostocoides japonicum]|uniref:hypothetical protein n=1 Tax=Nostocoides japonicum TaxID=99481 RepID=UPI00065C08EA|nr:hypothetical protein [Tetrasphaera japonica]
MSEEQGFDSSAHEGEEQPRIPPPQRYEGAPADPSSPYASRPPAETSQPARTPPTPAPSPGDPSTGAGRVPTVGERLMAVSGSLSVVVFLLLGFVFHAWAWAWLVFLVPGLVWKWNHPGEGRPRNRR